MQSAAQIGGDSFCALAEENGCMRTSLTWQCQWKTGNCCDSWSPLLNWWEWAGGIFVDMFCNIMGAQQRVVCLALAEFRFMSCSNLYTLAGSCLARSSSVIVLHLVSKVCILPCSSYRFTFFTSYTGWGLAVILLHLYILPCSSYRFTFFTSYTGWRLEVGLLHVLASLESSPKTCPLSKFRHWVAFSTCLVMSL